MGCHWFFVVSALEKSKIRLVTFTVLCEIAIRDREHTERILGRPTKPCSSCLKWLSELAGKNSWLLAKIFCRSFSFLLLFFVLVSRSQLSCLLLFIFFSCCAVFRLVLMPWKRPQPDSMHDEWSPLCGWIPKWRVNSVPHTVEAMRACTVYTVCTTHYT